MLKNSKSRKTCSFIVVLVTCAEIALELVIILVDYSAISIAPWGLGAKKMT
jgi:hypothetical protein